MQSFRDAKNRTWEISVNVMSAERIKKLADVDVFALVDNELKPLAGLLSRPHQFVMILWALLKPKLEEAKVTPEDFGESMVGDALQGGIDAFVEALIDFFPQKQTRESLRLLMKKSQEVNQMLLEQTQKELALLKTEEIAEEVKNLLQNKSGNSSTNAPESFGLTPAHSLSVAS